MPVRFSDQAEQRPTAPAVPGRRPPLPPTRRRGPQPGKTVQGSHAEAACPRGRSCRARPAHPFHAFGQQSRGPGRGPGARLHQFAGSFCPRAEAPARGGFRGALYNLTGGGLNLGPSAKQREEDELARRISRQLQGSYNTAVLSLKGGIGKTSTTVGVGLTLAEFRAIRRAPSTPTPIPATSSSAPSARASTSSEPAHHHGPAQEHRVGRFAHRPGPLHAPPAGSTSLPASRTPRSRIR